MSRFNEIAKIYDYKLSQLRDPQVWQNTLRLTSNFWRLNFCAAMLLTEQNPKAVMCGTLAQWNNVGRYVRHGERSTAIFMDRNNTELMYLFDVTQTYGTAYNAKWKLSERMADGIVGKFNAENAENAVSFEDFLKKSLDKNIDIVYNYDSKLNNSMAIDPRIANFIRLSAECICMTRCGIEADYDFSDAVKFNSDLSIVEVGNAATALAQEVLRDVDRTVRRKEYERYEAGVCGRHLRYPLRGRQERTAEPEIPELWKEGHDAAGAQGGRYDERNGSDSARPGEHERAVSENLEGDWTESRERQEPHNTYSDEEGAAQPDLHGERTAEDGNRYSGSGSSVGFDSDERDLAGGGSQEPWTADEDQGYSSEYDDEELNEDNEMVSDETDAISVFSDRPEEIDSKSEYAQKLLEDEILHGNHSAGGKFRITEYISDNSPTNDEFAKFLKNEYGIGGGSRSGIVKFSNHDGKGLALILGNNGNEQTVRFGWKVVAKAIRKAVDEGRYITEKDIESARRYTQFDAEHFAIHYEYQHCFENSRLQSIRKDIKRTGLDIQIRLTPELFATYAEEYIRAQPHVKEEYQKIERSSVNAPYCFNDWSTAAEAARTLTAESGYPKFRSLCRDSASELVTQLTNHTGHNPGLGFPEEEITEFLNSGEISEDKWTDEITAQVFGYLFNIEQRDHLYDNNVAAFSEETSAQLTFDNFEEENSDISIGIAEPTEKDILEKVPTITCEWSESPAFEEGKTYSVLEFDTIMKREDTDWVSKRQQELKAFGGDIDKLHAAREKGELKVHHQGYAKTHFTVNMPNGTSYSERQDIGDGYGGVIDFLDRFGYKHVAEELKKAISDELEKYHDELPHDEAASSGAMEATIEYINDFCETEYGSTADFDDLTHVDLAYTTDEDTDTIIGVYADLVNYRIITEYGNATAREEQYDSLDEMNEIALKNLAFDDLVYLSEEEKALPHDEAADFSVNDNSDIPDFFIRDIEEHKEIRISEKEKTALLYPVDNASDLKLGNYRLSYIGDESAYALIADSEKAGADIFVHQFSHNDGASEIYSHLREKDMQPYHDDTEVPHRDAPVSRDKIDRNFVFQKLPPVGNYRFPENFAYPTGPKAKYTANVTAIKTLKQIESEHRHATAEEQDILAHYSGWGGIADAFDSKKENWSREYAELKDLLTEKEYSAARESTLTAFYTEPYIIKSIYTALENMGFTGGEILDPAMGTGNFFGNLPAKMAENSRLYGVELDSLTARIAKELYPEAKIQNRGFERTKLENGTFDVIIGNVPFGDFKPYDPEYDEYLIHDYFFAKSIDKLKPGGIMALITSAGTMDKYDDSFRRELAGKADFLGGVRLPEDAFRTAGTQTVTDILFFQKLEFEHMEKSQRRRFLSKISVGNFDAIVIPQSQFEKMPLSLERQEAMYDEKLTEISSAIQAAKADKGERFTVKALERQRKQIEKKIEKMRAAFKKDDFITFEELGCDFLFVDEAHNYKNLAVFSKMNNVAGVNANANSQKAFDMEMKCRYLQELHNGGGVVFATGTLISNSITELFVWQYLLQKQTLDDMNIGYFDNWASVFGVITQSIEVKPSGDGFRPRTRFSNFVNLNELCNLFGEVFDIAKTADMNLKLPAIQNGKPEMIICEKSPEQELQTDAGIERARKIEAKMVQPDEDNMLAVCTYMTKVALDARIIDPEANEYDGGKIALCAEKIIEINRANPGTAQAVFCDTNTPKKDAFSVYQALRDRLVRSGEFAENEIAFVHDAANDKQRLAMFERVNNAEIKIIIGSTGKLGTGVNIQRKLSALHHLDAPYRPSDIEQRNGRGIRQGNENSEVYIGYYSTKGTFDNYRWQILEKKQQIISQIMSGKPAARTCEDIDDTALTFAEMKAATTGNPLIAEKMTVDNEVNRLKLLHANYYQQQRSFEYDISRRYPDLISRKEKMIEWTKKDIELISAAPPITEDNFRMTLGGRTFVERSKAGDELAALVTKYMMSDDYQEYKSRAVGELNDFKIVLMHRGALVSLSLKANGHYTCDYSMSGLGGVTRLCNLYERIPEQIHGLNAELEQAKKQLANAKEQYGKPFQYEEQLRAGLERQAQINAELEVADKPHDEAVMSDYSDDENEEMEM